MEATGIYYEKAADMLSSYYTVYVINPLKSMTTEKAGLTVPKPTKQIQTW